MAKTLADKILNPSQKLWMETIYSKLKNNEPFNRKSLKVELSNQLPKGFTPKDISHRLLRNDTELTLLGTALVNPKSYMVGKADKVIQTISNLLKTNSDIDRITSQEISQKTKISESDVGIILQMLSEIGYYHNDRTNDGSNILNSITIDEKTFDRYIEYPNFTDCLDAAIEDINNSYIGGIHNPTHPLFQELKINTYEKKTDSRKIFIGHGRSAIWRDLKDFLQDRLHLDWDEFNRESVAGIATVERLETMLGNASFAFLIMTAEDVHADKTLHARENVIHEIGLFQGKLGFRRAIILLEEGCEEFSNITGVSQIRFPKNDIEARFEAIRRVLEREGMIENKEIKTELDVDFLDIYNAAKNSQEQ